VLQQAENTLTQLRAAIVSMEQLRASIPTTTSSGGIFTTSEILDKALREAAESWRSLEWAMETFHVAESDTSEGG
jgi:hypothetical protein